MACLQQTEERTEPTMEQTHLQTLQLGRWGLTATNANAHVAGQPRPTRARALSSSPMNLG